ncbi:RNA-directed DNA polymerase from mobile element jockey-like protein, partial [Leptotrombidium deliense]
MVPVKQKLVKYKSKQSWFNKEIQENIEKRTHLYKCFKKAVAHAKDNINEMYNRYKKQRNCVTSLIRIAKMNHFDNLLVDCKNDPKKFWRILKEIVPTKSKSSDSKIADINKLNKDFVKTAYDTVNCVVADNEFYLNNLNPKTSKSLKVDNVTITEMKKVIKNLNKNSATGCDLISVKIINIMNDSSLQFLCDAFNHSLNFGVFPNLWKVSRISPIPKKGTKDYRPISVISIVSKIIEKIVHQKLYKHVIDINYFHPNQFGFRPTHNTESACLSIQNFAAHALEK